MGDQGAYQPPFSLTSTIVSRVAEIGELIGAHAALSGEDLAPRLRRDNRIRTIHASLAIENNTLTLEQVTSIIAGKRVLGPPEEIQEVRNAFAAYQAMEDWDPCSRTDLLAAHGLLMAGLVDEVGVFRSAGVGVFRAKQLVHMAPPAPRVPQLVDDLLDWLGGTDVHPLVSSCVVHYELEFIHPFADGNGRMGRLWQTLILRKWKPLLAYLPVETVIRERQEAYYRVLAVADDQAEATLFVEFMLDALHAALKERGLSTDQAGDQVSDQVSRLIKALAKEEKSSASIMKMLALSHRPTFRKNYLTPSLEGGWVERTEPDSPRSPTQRYRLTDKGRHWLQNE
ncbi:MAG: Fic family protein [Deltaproteobacteria bacterium]|nr:Fic family protein [Deltaproteobacteria bacterium]